MDCVLRYWRAAVMGALCVLAASSQAAAEAALAESPGKARSAAGVTTKWPQRTVFERDGITVEFSPGHEMLAEAVAAEAIRWNEEADRHFAAAKNAPPQALGALDARLRRDVYLAEVAREIGLEQPSELMQRCYDTMLAHYEMLAGLYAMTAEAGEYIAKRKQFAIWDRSELIGRLEAGEKIAGMSWDPVKQEGDYAFDFKFNIPRTEEEKKVKEEAEMSRLTHAFNYTVKDGIAHITARFTIGKKERENKSGSYSQPANLYANRSERTREFLKSVPTQTLPLVLKDDGSKNSVEALIQNQRELTAWILKTVNPREYRDARLVLVLLHETIEVGIIEHYIGSADRRWLCDGAANFVAWKIARRHAGDAFAKQVYDLEGQLQRHKEHQNSIRLKKWPAVENEKKEKGDPALSEAHYPFATRAVALIASRHGEDTLMKLFSEIGKTPRPKVRYKTVRAAFKKTTGEDLDAVLVAAEKNPIAGPPTERSAGR